MNFGIIIVFNNVQNKLYLFSSIFIDANSESEVRF